MNALALIIGNSKYPGQELDHPGNDAEDFSGKLKSLGFVVKRAKDVDLQQFDRLIDNFGNELNNYDVGLFYFAGHGIQIDGDNFITAVNTNFESEVSVKYSSVTLNKVLAYMDKAKNNTNIIILDACRDNPYEKKWNRSIKSRGLAPMYAPKGTLIAFATSPGETASDGGGRNGLYTEALLKHIDDSNIQVEEFFKRVRNTVYTFSKGKQTSWEHTSLTGTFIFNSGQLLQVTGTIYSPDAIADKDYLTNSKNPTDQIIKELRTHDWYKQNPAVKAIHGIETDKTTINQLFVLGRNILQTACGGEWAAVRFMNNLNESLAHFNQKNENHVLNGMLFEIYFNSEGKFRGDRFKTCFLDRIFDLQGHTEFSRSFLFISQQLQPFRDELFYIPSDKKTTVSIDVVLDKSRNKDHNMDEYKVASIKHEGLELLRKDEHSRHFAYGEGQYFEYYMLDKFKYWLAENLIVSSELLVINLNHSLPPDAPILFPIGNVVAKH